MVFPAWDPHLWFSLSYLPHLLWMLSIHITLIILTNCPLPLTCTLHLQQPALSFLCSTITFEYGCVLSRVWLFETPRTVACQAPLSLPFPSSGDLPNSELQPASPVSTGWFFTSETPGKPTFEVCCIIYLSFRLLSVSHCKDVDSTRAGSLLSSFFVCVCVFFCPKDLE